MPFCAHGCCADGAVAVLMNFVNRYTLLAFPMPTVVLMLQMLATVVILHPLLLAGKLDFPHFSWQRCKQLLLISILYTGNTAFALFGLRTMNIPMYSTLKRLTPMMVLVCKVRGWPAKFCCRTVLISGVYQFGKEHSMLYALHCIQYGCLLITVAGKWSISSVDSQQRLLRCLLLPLHS